MNKNKHSSSVVTRTGALTTPFASRGSRAECSMHRSMVNRSLYSPLTDPHLKHFFRQKLISGLSRSEKRPSSRYGVCTCVCRAISLRCMCLRMYLVLNAHVLKYPIKWRHSVLGRLSVGFNSVLALYAN